MGDPHPYNLIIYKKFKECWITSYEWDSDVGENGDMKPIIERITVKYTYQEGHPSSKDDQGKEIGKKVSEVWHESFGN